MESARLTPYELVFGNDLFEGDRFPAIADELRGRGADPADPEQFLMLGTVAELLRELPAEVEPEQEAGPWGDRGSPIRQYGLLLFHGFHFWRYDKELYLLETGLARRLAGAMPEVGGWELVPPHPAGYLQLPRHLFWARLDEDAQPEPVDGMFWTLIGREDPKIPPYDRLDLLLALGMRPGRPGFGVVGISEAFGVSPAGHWADVAARPDGDDFANVLPGGEMKDLYAFVTPAEPLKLLSRCFHYVAEHAPALEPRDEPPAEREPGEAHRLPPSRLTFQRIHLVEQDG